MNGTVITSAICRKLHAIYPNISIYREHIDDGFDEPSFFVWTSGINQDAAIHPRMFIRHKIEVSYFPNHSNNSMYEELLNIGLSLLESLSRIDVEIGTTTKPVFSINPGYSIIDDNFLQFSAEYLIEGVIDDGSNVEFMGNIDSDIVVK